ncbi:hypothetical protein PoB_001264500 [Plakobranchus ocellatus]|uniref:Uncharacterized protein n=1 Tax=Plakobranchus ocellatus TaxID=259542 RepID=A0AAV3YUN2_9GAST|nr:hypothetical protein PoB_001264500 [Plakobranchus ocellatus]
MSAQPLAGKGKQFPKPQVHAHKSVSRFQKENGRPSNTREGRGGSSGRAVAYKVRGGRGGSSGRAVAYKVRGPGFESQSGPNHFIIAPPYPPRIKWPVRNKVISSFQALRQAPVAELEPGTEASPQISGGVAIHCATEAPSIRMLVIPPIDLQRPFCRGFEPGNGLI